MSDFFTRKTCQRCNGSLAKGRIMSMFNTDCLCMSCHVKEQQHPDYTAARNTDDAEIRKGIFNFEGIGSNPGN